MLYTVNEVLPGIRHISETMGVGFTLIEGKERAILFDTGYGMEDVKSFVGKLTQKSVTVLLSHGHHDHMLGARWFEKTYLCAEDMEEFMERTGETQRTKVEAQAKEANVPVPADFMTAEIAQPEKIRFTEKAGSFERRREELGGMEVQVIKVPGHTPGSIVLYVPAHDLLLTGDDLDVVPDISGGEPVAGSDGRTGPDVGGRKRKRDPACDLFPSADVERRARTEGIPEEYN